MRAAGVRAVADVRLVDRDVAPAEDDLALGADVALDELLDLLAVRRVVRAGSTRRRRSARASGSSTSATPRKKRVGQLDEDPRAVARAHVGALGAAVLEVVERLERALDDLVATARCRGARPSRRRRRRART